MTHTIRKRPDSLRLFFISGLCITLLCARLTHGAVSVTTVTELVDAVTAANNGGDKEIRIQPGTYKLEGAYLRITADHVSILGDGEERGDVILDGGYKTTEILQIVASHVQIRNLTLKHAYYHPIHAIGPDSKDSVGILVDNVHIIDPGQQAIKINPNGPKTHFVNSGTVSNSLIELTQAGREKVWEINGSCYTGGVDAHHAADWVISDNEIRGFWCAGGLSEHGVHFWSDSQDTLVERNLIIDCDRGIGFGLGSSAHHGGIIRNNMIYHGPDHGYSDVGIGLESANNIAVYNNTIFHEHSYSNGIEYRFAASTGNSITNNLTNKAIRSRNGGTAELSDNVTDALAEWFVDKDTGDLHLAGNIPGVIDAGTMVSGLQDDIDKEKRYFGEGVDIGADEKDLSPPSDPPKGKALSPTYLLLLN